MEDLRSKHVVVTGATGGLGPAIVEMLLACGATVSAVSRLRTSLDALRADLRNSDRLNVAEADLSDGSNVEKLFDALERGTGPIDGVVHTVGGFHFAPLAKTSDETIDSLYRALLLSPVLVTRAALRRMIPRRGGRIVLTAGQAAMRPSPNTAVYAAMKAGVASLVTSAAREVATDGITVNALVPGTIDTPANRRDMRDADPSRWVAPATIALAAMSLLGEAGRGVSGALITVPDRVS